MSPEPRYYRETPCEKCGVMVGDGIPGNHVRPADNDRGFERCDGSGGTRVEVTIDAQIDRLARYIVDEIPGEPSQSQGAIDTAIRLLGGGQDQVDMGEGK